MLAPSIKPLSSEQLSYIGKPLERSLAQLHWVVDEIFCSDFHNVQSEISLLVDSIRGCQRLFDHRKCADKILEICV